MFHIIEATLPITNSDPQISKEQLLHTLQKKLLDWQPPASSTACIVARGLKMKSLQIHLSSSNFCVCYPN